MATAPAAWVATARQYVRSHSRLDVPILLGWLAGPRVRRPVSVTMDHLAPLPTRCGVRNRSNGAGVELSMRHLVALVMLAALLSVGCGEPVQQAPMSTATSVGPTTTSAHRGPMGCCDADAERERQFSAAVRALEDEAQRQFPDRFGGLYRTGGRVKLAFIRDAEELTAALLRHFPRPDLVDALSVTFSLAQLQSAAERISADSRDLEARGIKLATWFPDLKGNRVHVGVEDLTPADAELIKARYGAAMLVVVEQSRLRAIGDRNPELTR